jgi:hypothetical protein
MADLLVTRVLGQDNGANNGTATATSTTATATAAATATGTARTGGRGFP